MRKLPLTTAEELLEIIMQRYERASTLLTSHRPVEDWDKLLGYAAATSAMLDRLLHHGHALKCEPKSWRTKTGLPGESHARSDNPVLDQVRWLALRGSPRNLK
jgi:DNA replication protein DnaC